MSGFERPDCVWHCWCSGIMQDSHSCDPGSIPGQCTVLFLFQFCLPFPHQWTGLFPLVYQSVLAPITDLHYRYLVDDVDKSLMR